MVVFIFQQRESIKLINMARIIPSSFNRSVSEKVQRQFVGYKMTENVNKIVEKFQKESITILEGKIREKDLHAAAIFLGEPLFVSKGRLSEQYFEKNALVGFVAVRDRYLKYFEEAIHSLDKKKMFSENIYSSPRCLDDFRLAGFKEYISYNYNAFYPYSKEYIK